MAGVHSSRPSGNLGAVSGCVNSWTHGRSTGSEIGVNNGEPGVEQVSSSEEAQAEGDGGASAGAGDAWYKAGSLEKGTLWDAST